MVGVLRDGSEPDFTPQPVVADIQRLAGDVDGWPRVEVRLAGELDEISPSVGVALYRMAQELVTNALRHARHASLVAVDVAVQGDDVCLTVHDDGDAPAVAQPDWGYGIVGMTERAALLGGTLRAGPGLDTGWTVAATLPKRGAT